MRFLIQRVKEASVTIDSVEKSSIDKGFLVLIGISQTDTAEIADKMIKKLTGLRIFEDEEGKTNKSLSDVKGDLLLVSQFTLYANCKKGNRPSFIEAGAPDMSEALYNYIVNEFTQVMKNIGGKVETGSFGADMKVNLINDGPFTIWLDSDNL